MWMATTLKKVAELAGVSHTTVSLVINQTGGSRVNPETRVRVLEAAQKLDYNLNLTAKRLVSGKTNSIGLYTPFETPIFRNYTFNETVTGIQDILYSQGFDIVLFSGGRTLYKDRPIEQLVRQNTVDGLIIFNSRYTSRPYIENYIRNLNTLKFRFSVIDYYWGNAPINYVGIDYEKAAYDAVNFLISLGHNCIALVAGTSRAQVTDRVISGYRCALVGAGIKTFPGLIEYTDYNYELAYEKTRKLLRRHPDLTAIFAGGFEMVPACLRAVKEANLKVPEDVSILCYVDSDIMPMLDPPVSAIKWPFYEMGKQAASLLIEPAPGKQKILFDTQLLTRGSTAPRC